MPRIREIESQAGVAGPIGGRAATAQDFGAGIGQGVESFGQAVEGASDAIQKRQKQAEYSDFYAQHSEKQAQWIEKFRDELKKAKPGDSEFASRMMTQYQEDMSKLTENLSQQEVKEYAKRSNAESASQFFRLAQSGQAELAAVQISQNFDKALSADGIVLSNDPTQLQSKLTNLDSYVETLQLDPDKRQVLLEKGRDTLVASAMKGVIELDPTKARADIVGGKYDQYFKDGVQKDKFLTEAREEESRRFYEDMRMKKQQDDILEKEREETKTKFIDQIFAGGGLSTKDIKNSSLTAAEKEHFYQLSAAKKHDVTNNAKFASLVQRVHGLDENNPSEPTDTELIQALLNKEIDESGLRFLRNEKLGKNTVEGKNLAVMKKSIFNAAKQTFKGSGYVPNQDWATDYAEFTKAMNLVDARYRREGKPLDALYDIQNEDVQKLLNQFRKSDKQILKQKAAQVGGNLDKAAVAKQAPLEARIPQAEDGKKQTLLEFATKKRLEDIDPLGNRARTYPGFKERIEKEMREQYSVYEDWKKNPRRYNAWTSGQLKALFEDIIPDAKESVEIENPNGKRDGESIQQWKQRTGRS